MRRRLTRYLLDSVASCLASVCSPMTSRSVLSLCAAVRSCAQQEHSADQVSHRSMVQWQRHESGCQVCWHSQAASGSRRWRLLAHLWAGLPPVQLAGGSEADLPEGLRLVLAVQPGLGHRIAQPLQPVYCHARLAERRPHVGHGLRGMIAKVTRVAHPPGNLLLDTRAVCTLGAPAASSTPEGAALVQQQGRQDRPRRTRGVSRCMARACSRTAGRHSAKAPRAASSLHSLPKRRASSCSAAAQAAVAADGQGGSFREAAAACRVASTCLPTSCTAPAGLWQQCCCCKLRSGR